MRVPQETIRRKLLNYDALNIKCTIGKEQWKPKSRGLLINNDDLEILSSYNAEIRGLYNYYSLAGNCSKKLHQFRHVMEYSLYKTFARKYRTSVRKICRRYRKDGVFTVSYHNRKGQYRQTTFYDKGFTKTDFFTDSVIDKIPNTNFTYCKTGFIDRLRTNKCELCGATGELDMHHVRKLKDLKGKNESEKFMLARKRKTIAICPSCHVKIHSGKFQTDMLVESRIH
jgi:hypothetical protein